MADHTESSAIDQMIAARRAALAQGVGLVSPATLSVRPPIDVDIIPNPVRAPIPVDPNLQLLNQLNPILEEADFNAIEPYDANAGNLSTIAENRRLRAQLAGGFNPYTGESNYTGSLNESLEATIPYPASHTSAANRIPMSSVLSDETLNLSNVSSANANLLQTPIRLSSTAIPYPSTGTFLSQLNATPMIPSQQQGLGGVGSAFTGVSRNNITSQSFGGMAGIQGVNPNAAPPGQPAWRGQSLFSQSQPPQQVQQQVGGSAPSSLLQSRVARGGGQNLNQGFIVDPMKLPILGVMVPLKFVSEPPKFRTLDVNSYLVWSKEFLAWCEMNMIKRFVIEPSFQLFQEAVLDERNIGNRSADTIKSIMQNQIFIRVLGVLKLCCGAYISTFESKIKQSDLALRQDHNWRFAMSQDPNLLWEAIRTSFMQDNMYQGNRILDRVRAMKYDPSVNPIQFRGEMKELFNLLRMTEGFKGVPDKTFDILEVQAVIKALPPSMSQLENEINRMPSVDAEYIYGALQRLYESKKNSSFTKEFAPLNQKGSSSAVGKINASNNNNQIKSDKKCHRCDRPGHLRSACYAKNKADGSAINDNNNNKGSNMNGANFANKSANRNNSNNWRNQQKKIAQGRNQNETTGHVMMMVDSYDEGDNGFELPNEEDIEEAHENGAAASATSNSGAGVVIADDSEWLLDSATTHHVKSNSKGMTDIENIPGTLVLVMANRTVVRPKQWGKFQINYKVQLTRVVIVPNGGANLVCLAQVIDGGYSVDFSKTSAVIFKGNRGSTNGVMEFTRKEKSMLWKLQVGKDVTPVSEQLAKPNIRYNPKAEEKKAESRARIPKKSKDDSSSSDGDKAAKAAKALAEIRSKRCQSMPASVSSVSSITSMSNMGRTLLSVDRPVQSTGYVMFNGPADTVEATRVERTNYKKSIYHYLLGHISNANLRKLNTAYNLGLSSKLLKSDELAECKICSKAALRAHPLHNSPIRTLSTFKSVQRNFDRLHCDLIGPMTSRVNNEIMRVKAIGGYRYVLHVIDEYSHYAWAIPLKTKDDTFNELTSLIKLIKVQFDRTPREVHSDSGGEFVNQQFAEFVKENGIVHSFTPRAKPEQNGIIERRNGIVMNKARAMLLQSGAKPYFWALAVQHAELCVNNIPFKHTRFFYVDNNKGTRREDDDFTTIVTTPFYELHHFMFNIRKIHSFGCDAEVIENKVEPGKLDARTRSGVYVGYDVHRHCSIILIPYPFELYYSNDVKFFENSFINMKKFKIRGGYEQVEKEELIQLGKQEELITNLPDESIPARTIPDIVDITDSELTPEEEKEIEEKANQQQQLHELTFEAPEEEVPAVGEAKRLLLPIDANIQPAREKRVPVKREIYDPSKRRMKVKKGAIKAVLFNDIGACMANGEININEPRTFTEAMHGPDKIHWAKAIEKEVSAINDRGVMSPTYLPAKSKALGTKWVFRIKRDKLGRVASYKARLVVQGFSQREGIDFTDTFAPVMRAKTLKLFISTAAYKRLELKLYDFESAFLNGKLNEAIYIKVPEGFEIPKGYGGKDLVMKLNKSLYGLRQAPLIWYEELTSSFINIGYVQSVNDPCVLLKVTENGIICVSLYVDDTVSMYDKADEAIWLNDIAKIKLKYPLKELGDAEHLLNMKIERDRAAGTITLSQESFIETLITKFNLSDAKSVPTPSIVNLPTSKELKNAEQLNDENKLLLQSIIGSLMYLSNTTRPDITFATNAIARKVSNPTTLDMKAAKRIIRYLIGTKSFKLIFGNYDESKPVIEAYSDSDWSNDRNDSKSITGNVIKVFNSVITWTSRKQATVALSSCEAEYMSVSTTSNDVLFIQSWLKEILNLDVTNTPIYTDSTSCIAISKTSGYHARVKHISVRVHSIRERISNGQIKLVYVNTVDNPADLFTKAISPKLFNKHITFIFPKQAVKAIETNNDSNEVKSNSN